MTFVMLFSLAGCNVLAQYKEAAKAELDAYVAALDCNDYSEDNWAAIVGHLIDGKTEINVAANKTAIDTAVTAAKNAIDDVETLPKSGTFYTLKNAYEMGLITRDDLMYIGYFVGEAVEIIDYDTVGKDGKPLWAQECGQFFSGQKEDWQAIRVIDFTPAIPRPIIDPIVKADILRICDELSDPYGESNEKSNMYCYYGEYNGCYVTDVNYGGSIWDTVFVEYAGIIWIEDYNYRLSVFVYDKK